MSFKPLPIGVDNFEKLINNDYYYIDKTLLIKELLDNKTAVTLFTRPRRFGKTLNMSMLKYFFEKEITFEGTVKDNSYLFKNTKIINTSESYLKHMGQYPIINLSLKSSKQPSFELSYRCIKDEIINEYRRHKYILSSDKLLNEEKIKYERICNDDNDEGLYITSIKFLGDCLKKYFNKNVIILIDEYDVPLENSFFEKFYPQMVNTIRSLFESALKTNSSLEFAVLTGCLRISKESIFTGLNNLDIISILNNYYSEYFGFTEAEVKAMLNFYGLSSKFNMIKSWYDGYVFGNTEVYNPWSCEKIVKDLYKDINFLPISYWANTSSNNIIRNLIEKADLSTKEEIENLIIGKTIEKPVHEDITYDEVFESMDNLWNFLFFTGYLKKVSQKYIGKDMYIELKIPNEEVNYIFRSKILTWFKDKIKVKDLSILYDAIIDGNTEIFQKELRKLLRQSISFNDSYENFYHGFVLGILMNMNDYIIKSNRECGSGRSDIYIKSPSVLENAIIIEFKVADNIKDLNKKCDEALSQIDEKSYEEELKTEGYENIIKYGIAFYHKDCMIKKGP